MNDRGKIRKIKNKHESRLMQQKGVVGCAVGYKHVGGKPTEDLCIVCYVRKKKPLSELGATDRIPAFLEGIPTDVVESGELKAL